MNETVEGYTVSPTVRVADMPSVTVTSVALLIVIATSRGIMYLAVNNDSQDVQSFVIFNFGVEYVKELETNASFASPLIVNTPAGTFTV